MLLDFGPKTLYSQKEKPTGRKANAVDDPLEYIDFGEILQHGDPGRWKFKGQKAGSGVPAHSPNAPPGTQKIYEVYDTEFGDEIEVHYFRHADGTVSDVKVRKKL
jgi:hypothetical protein